jgi:hypothetical protein
MLQSELYFLFRTNFANFDGNNGEGWRDSAAHGAGLDVTKVTAMVIARVGERQNGTLVADGSAENPANA